jgi:geranylgeranyl diphosphate synthase, type II
MDALDSINRMLEAALADAAKESPPKLAQALRYAVFPGGARLRPKLAMSVGWACGAQDMKAVVAGGSAIELLHCASLVHDDLPCFDDAGTRRGKPALHRVYGDQLAVLAGDALIVMAFDVLAVSAPGQLVPLTRIVSRASGAAGGIAAGQAWECESQIDLSRYHCAKTGSLFSAATMAGAAAAGMAHEPWRAVGLLIGEAYQVADDIRDAVGDAETLGKPVGRDAALARPSACQELGLEGAIARLKDLVQRSIDAVPDCPRRAELAAIIRQEAKRFLPEHLALLAA